MQFAPYLMTGYPNTEDYMKIIDALVEQGVTMIEAGVPFSDPAADGPTLTAINHEMVEQGATLEGSLELLQEVKKKHPQFQICLMTYLNPVLKLGIDSFKTKIRDIGIEYTLFPDLPHEEKQMRNNLETNVSIISDNLSDETIENISASTSGFLYLLSFIGTTGNEKSYYESLKTFSTRVRNLVGDEQKLYIGFGIKTKEDVDFIKTLPVDGYIIGSQIVKEIQKGGVEGVKNYVESLK